jgi:hypothetical protein
VDPTGCPANSAPHTIWCTRLPPYPTLASSERAKPYDVTTKQVLHFWLSARHRSLLGAAERKFRCRTILWSFLKAGTSLRRDVLSLGLEFTLGQCSSESSRIRLFEGTFIYEVLLRHNNMYSNILKLCSLDTSYCLIHSCFVFGRSRVQVSARRPAIPRLFVVLQSPSR